MYTPPGYARSLDNRTAIPASHEGSALFAPTVTPAYRHKNRPRALNFEEWIPRPTRTRQNSPRISRRASAPPRAATTEETALAVGERRIKRFSRLTLGVTSPGSPSTSCEFRALHSFALCKKNIEGVT